MSEPASDEPSGAERRLHERYATELAVDYSSGENFLFAYLANISEMGIFIRSDEPMPIGTELKLRFNLDDQPEPFELRGEVMWINPVRENGDNPNPGMGVRFISLKPPEREKVVDLVRAVAYLQD